MRQLSTRAIAMLVEAYSAFNESNVVKDPAPAIRGKTTGTSVASFMGPIFLNIVISRIISKDMKNKTREPAIANERMSTLNNLSIASPARKNPNINAKDIDDAFQALTGRPWFFKLMITGVEPKISITANNTMNALTIS